MLSTWSDWCEAATCCIRLSTFSRILHPPNTHLVQCMTAGPGRSTGPPTCSSRRDAGRNRLPCTCGAAWCGTSPEERPDVRCTTSMANLRALHVLSQTATTAMMATSTSAAAQCSQHKQQRWHHPADGTQHRAAVPLCRHPGWFCHTPAGACSVVFWHAHRLRGSGLGQHQVANNSLFRWPALAQAHSGAAMLGAV
jgi:hypothetical protein